jgi:hypothetical protein
MKRKLTLYILAIEYWWIYNFFSLFARKLYIDTNKYFSIEEALSFDRDIYSGKIEGGED